MILKKNQEIKKVLKYGHFLKHLRYEDDIALITDNKEKLTECWKKLVQQLNIRLNVNYAKTKTMMNIYEEWNEKNKIGQ